ncbi:MAG: quinone oxidoreductase family protein [Rhodospirillales bacterium]
MTHAIRIHAPGGADALRYEAVDLPAPGPGQATVRHTAIGVNFIDVYQRSGLYGSPAPVSLGMEGAGVVEAVGPDVVHVKPGDRIAYTGSPPGSYSTARTLPAGILVRLPDGIDDDVAASIMLKGMTSWYLLKRTHVARAGEAILVHAAAGGVGQILCQWAAHIGCTVIGTVGSDEKAAIARACGCHHPIVYTREDFVARVKEITGGTGVSVAYDSVGKDTFQGSFDCLRNTGHLISFGQSSGPPPAIETKWLAQKSASLTRPTLFHYIALRADLETAAAELFEMVTTGIVKIAPPAVYPLADAARAHRDLEGRRTTGSIVLRP